MLPFAQVYDSAFHLALDFTYNASNFGNIFYPLLKKNSIFHIIEIRSHFSFRKPWSFIFPCSIPQLLASIFPGNSTQASDQFEILELFFNFKQSQENLQDSLCHTLAHLIPGSHTIMESFLFLPKSLGLSSVLSKSQVCSQCQVNASLPFSRSRV